MRIDADTIIYAYLFICAALMVFNLFYIFRAKARKEKQRSRVDGWRREIAAQFAALETGGAVAEEHKKRLARRLRDTNALVPYCGALEEAQAARPQTYARYMESIHAQMLDLASEYSRRQSMERAYFADVIARFPPYTDGKYHPLMEILTAYMENSTVYCRENVLRALSSLGNAQAVETALQVLNDGGYFHHHKLLADRLTDFTGDCEALAARLWRHKNAWSGEMMVAVVEFITNCSENYCETFLPLLRDEREDLELRLCAMRYFRRHPYPPARPVLLDCLNGATGANVDLAIVSAAVLDRYPGKDTVAALKRALCHRNWYVRYNAASSLVRLGASKAELQDVFEGNDAFARDILQYMLEEKEMGRV